MERSDYLGGTDIAAICGESQFANVHDVWLEKMGLADPRQPSINMRVGTHMEPLIATMYEERMNKGLMTVDMVRHPKFEFIAGHPDRAIVGPEGREGTVELKNVTFQKQKWGDDDTTNCPTGYQMQIIWYAGIENALGHPQTRVDIAALIGNTDQRIYPIGWREELFDAILKQGIHFWNTNVIPAKEAKAAGRPFYHFAPTVDDTESAARMLKALWPTSTEVERDATEEEEAAIYAILEADRELKAAEKNFLGLKNQIIESMKDAGALILPSGHKVTYRKSKDVEKVDWKEVAWTVASMAANDKVSAEQFNDVIEQYLKVRPGSRRFTIPRKENGDV